MSHKADVDEAAQLRLKLFGGFALFDPAGEEISISLRKGQGLLAYLALAEGQRASREHLAGVFWGEATQQNARQSLRQVLFSLTRDLVKQPLSPLVIDSQHVSLRPDAVAVDVLRFRELAGANDMHSQDAALRAYGGELLKGYDLSSEAFESWLTAERQQLADLARMTVRAVIAHRREQGQLYQAITACQSGLRIDPLNEELHRTLMQLYVENTMHSSALAQYRYCQGLFRSELGVELEEETQRLYRRILTRGDGGETGDQPRQSEPPGSEETVPSLLFLERDELVGQLGGRIAGKSGASHHVVVQSARGFGKSELLRQLAGRAARGDELRVLQMRGCQQEKDLLLAPWMEVVGDLAGQCGESEALMDLRGALHAAVDCADMTTAAEHRIARALAQLLSDLGRRKASVLIVDDAHALDLPSLRLLIYCMRRAQRLNLRTLLSWNTDSKGPDGTQVRDLDCEALEVVELPGLSHRAIGRIAGAMLTHLDDETLPAVRREIEFIAEGNPMVAKELAWTLLKSRKDAPKQDLRMPVQVRHLLEEKLDGLSEAARRILDVLAVADAPMDETQLAQTLGWRAENVLKGVRELDSAGLIVKQANRSGYRVRREYERRAILEMLPSAQRIAIHRRLAAMLAVSTGEDEERCLRLAAHHQGAGDSVSACRAILAAAGLARGCGAYREAAHRLRRAEEMLQAVTTHSARSALRAEIFLEQARLAELGQHDAALSERLTAATGEELETLPAHLLHRMLMARARHAATSGEDGEGRRLFRQAIMLSRQQGRPIRPRAGDRLLGQLHLLACTPDIYARRLERLAQELRTREQNRAECEVAGALGLLLAIRGRFSDGQDRIGAALTLAERMGDELLLAAALQWSGMAALWQGENTSAESNLLRAEKIAEAHGDLLRLQMAKTLRAAALLARDELRDARASLQEARELAEDLDDCEGAALAAVVAARLAIGEGDPAAGRREAEDVIANPAPRQRPWIAALARRTLARALLDDPAGTPAEAERAARHAVAEQETLGLTVDAARSLVVQARAHRAAGNVGRAAEIYGEAAHRLSGMGLAQEAVEAETLAAALSVDNARAQDLAV